MQPVIICLGKIGDCLSCIALMQAQGYTQMVIGKQYADVAKAFPEIKTHVWDGDWQDLAGAIKWAKRKFRKVLIPQTYGQDFPIQHRGPSFQIDQAMRMGVKNWDGSQILALGSGKRSPQTSPNTRPKILVGDASESSPLHQSDALVQLLTDNFGKEYEIVRLSTVRLEKFTDFVEMYNQASALVTIETAHVHLSAASTVPTFVLATDKPQTWHGSQWHPRFKFYCRYSNYESRKDELVQTLKATLSGAKPIEVTPIVTHPANGYNASIADFNGERVTSYRYHPDPKKWRTELALVDSSGTHKIQMPEELETYSHEDMRLFVHRKQLWASYVISDCNSPLQPTPCYIGYGQLHKSDKEWSVINHTRPEYGGNDKAGQNKNWLVWSNMEEPHAIYQCGPEQIVVQLTGAKTLREYKSKAPGWAWGTIRGGTQPIPYKGKWIRFFHSQLGGETNRHLSTYYMGALVMEPQPPFTIIQVSSRPILRGNEQYFPDWQFWKKNVCIPYGAVPSKDGWDVSIGINDSACGIAHVKPEHLNL